MLKVSLDGETWQDVENVRVVREGVLAPGEEYPEGQLQFNFTDEGLVGDLWVSREVELDHNLATHSSTYDEISQAMVDLQDSQGSGENEALDLLEASLSLIEYFRYQLNSEQLREFQRISTRTADLRDGEDV